MPRIVPVHWKTLVKIFELYGCEYRRKKSSHHILICPNARRAVVIPEYNKIDVEIIKNNDLAALWNADHPDDPVV